MVYQAVFSAVQNYQNNHTAIESIAVKFYKFPNDKIKCFKSFVVLLCSFDTYSVLPDSLHAAGRHGCGCEQTQGGDSILVQGDVQSTVEIQAGGEDLGAVAPDAARPPLPRSRHGTGATPEHVSMNAELVVCKVGL